MGDRMIIELLGFLSGALAVGAAAMVFLRHERWRTINSVYGREAPDRRSRGNALIWPSH